MADNFLIITKNRAEAMSSHELADQAAYNFVVALNNQENPEYTKEWHARPLSEFYDALPILRDKEFSGAAKKNFESLFRIANTLQEHDHDIGLERHTFAELRRVIGTLPKEKLVGLVTTSKEEIHYIATQALLRCYLQFQYGENTNWVVEILRLVPVEERGKIPEFYWKLRDGKWNEGKLEKEVTKFMEKLLSKMEDVEISHLTNSFYEVFNKYHKLPSR